MRITPDEFGQHSFQGDCFALVVGGTGSVVRKYRNADYQPTRTKDQKQCNLQIRWNKTIPLAIGSSK